MKYIALPCVFATALALVAIVSTRAQTQAGSGMQDSGPYIFGKDIYEFMIAPNGNGMIYKFNGNNKTVAAVIIAGQIRDFGGKDLGDAPKAYAEWFGKAHPGQSPPVIQAAPGPGAAAATDAPSSAPTNAAETAGGDVPARIIWDSTAHTVTANGVQFSADGKHLKIVSGPYKDIGGEYETDAGHKILGLMRSAVTPSVRAAGGDPSLKSFWEFYIGRDDQQVKKFFFSTNSMDVAGKSGTPTPFLQQIADAAAQISADPKKPGWFHQPEGMDKIQKFLPPRR
jgi:hypothetical protein